MKAHFENDSKFQYIPNKAILTVDPFRILDLIDVLFFNPRNLAGKYHLKDATKVHNNNSSRYFQLHVESSRPFRGALLSGSLHSNFKMHFVEKMMMLISFFGRPLLGPNVVKMSKIAMWALIAIYISSVAWLLKSDNLHYNTLGQSSYQPGV